MTTRTDGPSVVVYTGDGGLLDPSQGVAGAWQVTGPRSAAWTLVVFPAESPPGYVAIRSTGEVDDGGNPLNSPYSFTVVGAGGTVPASGQGMSRYSRLPIEPIEAGGTPLAGFPTWLPAPPHPPPRRRNRRHRRSRRWAEAIAGPLLGEETTDRRAAST